MFGALRMPQSFGNSDHVGDVAVIGMACRFSRCSSLEDYWNHLSSGLDTVGPIPDSRIDSLGGLGAGARAGFMERIDQFDAEFFGISNAEADAMDPQQRIALEVACEALEDAGLTFDEVIGRRVGVFVGSMWDDYAHVNAGPAAVDGYTLPGIQRSIIANRLSRFLGVHGPSLVVDTGQSSSLMAVHLACQSLRTGESEVAMAAGVNVIASPFSANVVAEWGGTSEDGRCYVFDSRANGFVRGEGCGFVLLKALDAAVRDGDRIYSIIRGGGVSTGSGEGLVIPSEDSQRSAISLAYRMAGLSPDVVQYVELHGTGTPVGDPIEARALAAEFGRSRSGSAPLLVGSAKTNVGHLEAAAGIAGLIKVALSIWRRVIPPSLNFSESNPDIPMKEFALEVPVEARQWPNPTAELVAGVSSFGMGGVNCHIVMTEAAVAHGHRGAGASEDGRVLRTLPWVVSARSREALSGQAARLVGWPGEDPVDVAWSLLTTRSLLPHRAVVLGGDREQLIAGMDVLSQGGYADNVVTGVVSDGRLAVMFAGQGTQRAGMGRELYTAFPVFAEALDHVCEHLDPLLGRSLQEAMFSGDELDRTGLAQPALFALEVALFRLAQSRGVFPDVLFGHSIGEISAAHVAGVLSLADACTLVAARGRLMDGLPAGGAMIAVAASESEVADLLAGHEALAGLAAVNGPESVVVSGAADVVDQIADQLRARGRLVKPLRVSHAFHSPLMEPMLEQFQRVVAGLSFEEPQLPLISTVTGEPATRRLMGSPQYWVEHARRSVRFADAVIAAAEAGVTSFLELGPDGILSAMVTDCLSAHDVSAVPALRADREEPEGFLMGLARLFVCGVAVDWQGLFVGTGARRVDLPTYAFQQQRHWLGEGRSRQAEAKEDLRGRFARLPGGEAERIVRELVVTQVSRILRKSPESTPSFATASFHDLGFDSLLAVELRSSLEQAIGTKLPVGLVFDFPTVSELTNHILEKAGVVEKSPMVQAPTASAEPIAIVGVGCRYPGGVGSAEDLWRLVVSEMDVRSGFPTDRGWPQDLYDPDPDASAKSYVREGGFLDAGEFDAGFFGISPREALSMDPQQRLLLEVAWETLEDAGIDPQALKGSSTGVYVGATAQEYGAVTAAAASVSGVEGLLLTGNTPSVISGRVAYTLGLVGPAVTVDTACSSSLVALHMAVQALRAGECSMALAGGVTVLSTPAMFVEFSRQRGLSPDGRCKPFAAGADGVSWSEGVGLLLVERLSDARRNGHRVLAVVRGSAVNQDGASNGLAAPNGPSQQRVIRQALAAAGLRGGEIDVVEAHGTGTRLGDPIEAEALLEAYGQQRERPLWLGSVKSNIGHAQAAAGAAGVIKMVMAMRHHLLPRTLHVDTPTPFVDWSAGAVQLLTEPQPWPVSDQLRRAGVSSFGISGTNAHMILEEPSHEDTRGSAEMSQASRDANGALSAPAVPWVVSARSREALSGQAARLVGWPGEDPVDVAWSLLTTRSLLPHRAVVLGGDREQLIAGMDVLSQGGYADNVVTGTATPGRTGPVFVFPGQGSQWPAMARELMTSSPVFCQALNSCEEALSSFVDWSLLDVLGEVDGAPSLERVDVVQPVLFSVMVSLAALWRSFGIEPAAIVGHSQGEIAAAYIAGALSLTDAAKVVVRRSQALVELAGQGAMISVPLSRAVVEQRLRQWAGQLSVAAINGPRNVVVSGAVQAAVELLDVLNAEGVRAQRIPVNYAAHSAQVEQVRARLLSELADISPQSARTPVWSTVTGGWLDTSQVDGDYWYRNLREPVELEEAINNLGAKYDVFVEVSPHPVLAVGIQDTLEDLRHDATIVHSLRRDHGGMEQFLVGLARLFVCGFAVDWQGLFVGTGARRVDLPKYAFQHQRCWLESTSGAGDVAAAGLSVGGHPFLAAAVEMAGGGVVMTGRLGLDSHSWLADHAVGGVVLLPGTAFLELAVAAGDRVGCGRVEELTLAAPLLLQEQGTVQLQVAVAPADESGRCQISIHSRREQTAGTQEVWTEHATGTLASMVSGTAGVMPEFRVWPPAEATEIDVTGVYERIAGHGYHYGPAFQGLERVWRRGQEIFAEVTLHGETGANTGSFVLHPALFDAALHALLPGVTDAGIEGGLPFLWTDVIVDATGSSRVRVRVAPTGDGAWSLQLADAEGRPVARVQALLLREVSLDALQAAGRAHHNSLFRQGWVGVTAGEPADTTQWVVLGSTSVADALATAGLGGRAPDLARVRELMDSGGPVPPVVITVSVPGSDDVVADTYRRGSEMLSLVQEWLGEDRFSASRLMVVTRDAGGDAPTDLAGAAVRGLLKTAQTENPGRFVLRDIDQHTELSLLAGLDDIDEPDLMLRGNNLTAPRLVRASGAPTIPPGTDSGQNVPAISQQFDRSATVLITGGTGALGAILARHLVIEHGVRHLLLASRRGLQVPAAVQLQQQLQELGAQVTVTACDVTDRDAIAALIAAVPEQHPLRAVIHTAGVLDDGVITSMSTDQFEHVLLPKVDAAWHLHELTRELDLTAFVLYSSIAGVVGSAGQANYAAGNAFLDALARYRGQSGLPATSLAWGLWEQASTMTEHLDEIDLHRMARSGLAAMGSATGMELFDTALRSGAPALVPAVLRLDRFKDHTGAAPALFRDLMSVPGKRAAASAHGYGFTQRLQSLPPEQRRNEISRLVEAEVGAVLGFASRQDVPLDRAFNEIGFDSLTAVELRNRLKAVTGLSLTAGLVFDYPTVTALTDHLIEQLAVPDPAKNESAIATLGTLEKALAGLGEEDRRSIFERLRRILDAAKEIDYSPSEVNIEDATDEELFSFADEALQ
ncbi:type I polyketide synthase [Nocardia sp. NPDC004604]|uniref:type I polyketide synthase n=1 Tax=Nocardia sp. NPDC004604 TaxID=3157013 RepID=UPI0033A1C05D